MSRVETTDERLSTTLVATRRSLMPALLRDAIRHVAWLPVVVVLGFLVFGPVFRLLQYAFADGARAISTMLALPRFNEILFTTLKLGLGSTAMAIVLGTALSWWVYRAPRSIRGPLSVIPILPLVIPAVANVVGWAFLLSPRVGYLNVALRRIPIWAHLDSGPFDVFTVPWIIILTGFSLTSFVYVFVYSSLRSMGGELQAAAASCGASPRRTFWQITLPMLRPALVYSTGICVLLGLGQFTAPLLLGRTKGIDVLTTVMFRIQQTFPVDFGLAAALSLPLLAVGAVVVYAQQKILKNQERFVTASGRASSDVAASSFVPAILVAVYGIFAVLLPLLAIVYVALSPHWSGEIRFDWITFDNLRRVLFENPASQRAVLNSVRVSLTGAAIVIILGLMAGIGLLHHRRTPKWTRTFLDYVVSVPLGIPAAVMGFGMLIAYTNQPLRLYGTIPMLVVAYITIMIPHATRAELSSLLQISPEYWHASSASGANSFRTLFSVVIPMARSGIAGAAAIIIVLLFHEFTVSMMIRSPRTEVMGTMLFSFWTGGTVSHVAAMALVMVAVTAIGVAFAVAVAGRSVLEKI